MERENDTQESGSITSSTKQAYASPRLRNYGSLTETTNGTMNGGGVDSLGKGKSGS